VGQRYFRTFSSPRKKFLPRRSRYNNQTKIVAARHAHAPMSVGGHAESTCENAKPTAAFSPHRLREKRFFETYENRHNPPASRHAHPSKRRQKAIRLPARERRILLQPSRPLVH
jgi:hypothetical protein